MPFMFSSSSQKLKILRDLDTSDAVIGEKPSSRTDEELLKNIQSLILARESVGNL
jgi:hypothetical protein